MARFAPGDWLHDANRPRGSGARAAGRFRVEAGGRFDRHHHDGDELWFVVEGRGLLAVGDERITATAGDIVLMPAGVAHDILAVEGVLAGFFAELVGAGGEDAPGGHRHDPAGDADGHDVAALGESGDGS